MAATIFIQDGGTIDYIPPVDLPAGAVVVQGELVGVTNVAIKANKLGALAVQGIFDFPIDEGTDWSEGQLAFWSEGSQTATTDSETPENKLIGKVVKVNPRPGLNYVRIRMSQ